MPASSPSQVIFERYLHGTLSQEQAITELFELLRAYKATGRSTADLSLTKPTDLAMTPADIERAEAFLDALNQRFATFGS